MILRGIDFGPILNASGARGIFGEEYKHHKLLGPLRPNFNGCAFVAKTTTLDGRKGNMPMQEDGITPKELMPRCILPNFSRAKNLPISIKMFLEGLMLNAVSLSGPGAEFILKTHRWQNLAENFLISFMPVAQMAKERILELESFVKLLLRYLPGFKAKFGLQINYSCPNVGLDLAKLIDEAKSGLSIASELGIPLMPKFNVLAPAEAVKEISDDPNCDAICISNTIAWGKLPEKINWKKLFGADISPLAEFGGGALSGWPLLQLVEEWVREARKIGIAKPINAGGGILRPYDIDILHQAGASSVFIGAMATLRSWRVEKTIARAHQIFGKGNTR